MAEEPDLRKRVERLERQVQSLQAELAAARGSILGPPPAEQVPPPPPHVAAPIPQTPISPGGGGAGLEANLVGTWFARIGAVALLIGAAFAFRYAVNRGLIGPTGRTAIGLLSGVAVIGWGEWARRREYALWGQAVTGAGIGLLYLTLWAASEAYGLIGAPVALGLLTMVTIIAAALALRHESQALAAIATLGGFLNPLLVGFDDIGPASVYGYVFLLDLAVVSYAAVRSWRALDRIALGATWLAATGAALPASTLLAEAAGAALFLLFAVHPFVAERERRTGGWGIAFAISNGGAFFLYSMAVLDSDAQRGWLLLALAVVTAALGMAARRRRDAWLTSTQLGMSAFFLTLAWPFLFDGLAVPAVWLAEGVIILLVGLRTASQAARIVGAGIVGVAALATVVDRFVLGASYRPDRLLFSVESALMLSLVAGIGLTAWAFGRGGKEERIWDAVFVALANLVAVTWLTFEAASQLAADPSSAEEEIQELERARAFTYSAIWGLYASVLLVFGVATRRRTPRLLAVGLFGVTILKMVSFDVWTLSTGLRIIAFIGLGAVLLLSSLMYQRFRDLVVGSPEQ